MCLCLDLSFPSVVWLDPHVSMFVHVLVAFSTYLCFMPCQDPSFLCVVCLNLYAHMLDIMSMVTPCLDLHVCMHVLCSYAYVYAFTCLYARICVLPCFYAYMHMLRCTFTRLHAYFHAYMCRSACFMLSSMFSMCFMPSSMGWHASRHLYVLRPRPCLSCQVLL